jgi:hypothetical protein
VTDFVISPGASGSFVIGTANGAAIGTRFGPLGHITTINGTAGAPAYSFGNDSDTGMYLSAVGPGATLSFTVDGTAYMTVASSSTTIASGQLNLAAYTATTASAGAQTLPANPVGFLILGIGGTSRKIPYYAT